MRVFLDANVLFSASLANSLTGRFLEILRKEAALVASPPVFDEAVRNMERKVLARVPSLRTLVEGVEVNPLVAQLPGGVELVQKDRHVLAAAVASRCTHLLTGDERHFKHLFGQIVHGVKVVHTRMLAEEIGLKPGKHRCRSL